MQNEIPANSIQKNSRSTARRLLGTLVALLAIAASLIALPQAADAAPNADRLDVTARSNGRFALNYYPESFPSNFGQIDNYEVIDGNGMQVVGRHAASVFPGIDAPAHHLFETNRTYRDGRQVCFQVRAYSRTGLTTAWSEKTCAWAPTYSAPLNFKADHYPNLPGGSVMTWEAPDFIPMGSVLVEPEWIQIYDGNNYRWVQLGNHAPLRIGHSDYERAGKWTCYTSRFWVSGLGVSDWSNWSCLTLQ